MEATSAGSLYTGIQGDMTLTSLENQGQIREGGGRPWPEGFTHERQGKKD